MELLCSSQRGICEVPGAKKGTKGAEVDQGYKLPLFLLFYFKCHFQKKKKSKKGFLSHVLKRIDCEVGKRAAKRKGQNPLGSKSEFRPPQVYELSWL